MSENTKTGLLGVWREFLMEKRRLSIDPWGP
jgi:hypothetical protein